MHHLFSVCVQFAYCMDNWIVSHSSFVFRTNTGAYKGERQTKVRLNSVFFKNYRPFVERNLQIQLSLIQLCSSEVRKRYMAVIDQTIFLHSMLPLSKNFIIVHTTFVMHSFLCGSKIVL